MDSVIYRRRRELRVDGQPDGWAHVSRPGDEIGIVLDPKLSAIWSAARDCTAREVARRVGVSDYLASSALAVLSLGGLVRSEPLPSHPPLNSSPPLVGNASVSALVVHRHPRGDLDTSVGSVLNQGYPALTEIVILAERSTSYRRDGVRVVQPEDTEPSDSLIEQVRGLTGDAFLLLDSRVSLAPGALEEMVYTLELRGDIAAVAPRMMWNRWPRFVVGLGDWRRSANTLLSLQTGHLDVGQFERWQEVPAIVPWAGLISHEALRQIEPPADEGPVTWPNEWCLQARLVGYHIVAAAQALAYGPWPEPSTLSRAMDEAPPGIEKRSSILDLLDRASEIPIRYAHWPADLPLPEADAMLREGRPALTIEGVRGFYSHYPSVAPLPIRRRVVFVGQEVPRHRRMVQQLDAVCEVNWIPLRQAADDKALLPCRAVDLLITTAASLMRCDSLRQGDRPILVDMEPPVTLADRIGAANEEPLWKQVDAFADTPWDWMDVVDGIVCASEEERLYWLGALAARDRLNPYTRSTHPDLRDLVMVVPTGVEPITPPSRPVLKGVHPNVDAEDEVILWCGPLRAFDDPATVIRAFDALRSSQGDLKLLFAAFEGQAQDTETLRSAMRLATDLGLTERVLFERRIPRHLRDGYLFEADVVVALGERALEAQLSGPLALSACIGASLPIIVTDGHAGSHLIQRYGLGQTVSTYDVEAVSEALNACLERPREAYAEGFAKARRALAWAQVIVPLADFCQRPHYALDRLVEEFLFREPPTPSSTPTPLSALPLKAWRLLQEQGLQGTAREIRQYIRWKIGA